MIILENNNNKNDEKRNIHICGDKEIVLYI